MAGFTLDPVPTSAQGGFKLDPPGFKLDSGPGLLQRAGGAVQDIYRKAAATDAPGSAMDDTGGMGAALPAPTAQPAEGPTGFERWLTEQGIAKPESPIAQGRFLEGLGGGIAGMFTQPSILSRMQDVGAPSRRIEREPGEVTGKSRELAADIALGFAWGEAGKRTLKPEITVRPPRAPEPPAAAPPSSPVTPEAPPAPRMPTAQPGAAPIVTQTEPAAATTMPVLNRDTLRLMSEEAQLRTTDKDLAEFERGLTVEKDAEVAADRLNRLRAVDEQLKNQGLSAAERKKLTARRDQILVDTSPEELHEKSIGATLKQQTTAQRAHIASRLAEIEKERAQLEAQTATSPLPKTTPRPITPSAAPEAAPRATSASVRRRPPRGAQPYEPEVIERDKTGRPIQRKPISPGATERIEKAIEEKYPGGGTERGPGPILEPPERGETTRGTATRVDDALYRSRKNGTADITDLVKDVYDKYDKAERSPEFQKKVTEEEEERLVNPEAPRSPDVEKFWQGPFGKLKDEELTLGNKIRRYMAEQGEKITEIPASAVGYMRRLVKGKTPILDRLDPETGRASDPVYNRRTLSTYAPSIEETRDYYVADDGKGNRVWLGNIGKGTKYPEWEEGQNVRLDNKPGSLTVKPATINEIEANTPVRYHKNALISTIENVARLRRTWRNLQLLEKIKAEANAKGLYVPRSKPAPAGWVEVRMPPLAGYWEPKVGNVLRDFEGIPSNEAWEAVGKLNHILTAAIFWQPFSHGLNVTGHWTVGRGWDWIRPSGARSLMVDGTKAFYDVITMSPFYRQMLREGSGLIYGDVANQNFWKVLIEKSGNEIVRDPVLLKSIMRQFGLKTPKDFTRWWYRQSSKTLWAWNDIMMVQRVRELMRKGYNMRQAIQHAERDIPNYRVPSEVLHTRMVAAMLKDPNMMMFGRYRYGQMHAYDSIVGDLIRGGKAPPPNVKGPINRLFEQPRIAAAGRAAVLLWVGVMAYPVVRGAWQIATGNKDADIRLPGPWSIPQAISEFIGSDRGVYDYVKMMGSIMIPAPAIQMVTEFTRPYTPWGSPLVDPKASGMGKFAQAVEAAASPISPIQSGLQMMKPGGIQRVLEQPLGLRNPPPHRGQSARTVIQQNKSAAIREGKDEFEQTIKRGRDWIERQFR